MVFECCSNSRAKKLLKSGVLFTLINMSLLLQLLNLLKTCGLMMVISKNKQILTLQHWSIILLIPRLLFGVHF